MDHVPPFDQAWVKGFKKALLAYVKQYHTNAVRIDSWTETIDGYAYESGCDTCGYGSDAVYELTIYFRTAEDDIEEYVTTETFGEILRNLCYYR